MAQIYVRYEMPEELKNRLYEVVELAKETGKVRKGTNEVTKIIERGMAKLVIIAEDVNPPEVVAHIPLLCEEKDIPYGYVPSKVELGKRLGIKSAASAAIVDFGKAESIGNEIIDQIKSLKK